MTKKCIICGKRAGSAEHIFSSVFGGRRTNKGIYCGKHNNEFGRHVAALLEALDIFNSVVGVIPSDKDEVRPYPAMTAGGERYLVTKGTWEVAPPPPMRDTPELEGKVFPANFSDHRQVDLPSNVCSGGVRVNWDEVNGLLKQKLLFIHLSFDSQELPTPPAGRTCEAPYEPGSRYACGEPPVNRAVPWNELWELRSRLKRIPTTFVSPGRRRPISRRSCGCGSRRTTSAWPIFATCCRGLTGMGPTSTWTRPVRATKRRGPSIRWARAKPRRGVRGLDTRRRQSHQKASSWGSRELKAVGDRRRAKRLFGSRCSTNTADGPPGNDAQVNSTRSVI